MSQVDCNGSETGLYHCPSTSIGTQSCEKGIAAGIICNTKYGEQQPPTKTFFLYSSDTTYILITK